MREKLKNDLLLMLDKNVDVSRLLGHKRLGTTMEYITANSNSVKNNHQNYII